MPQEKISELKGPVEMIWSDLLVLQVRRWNEGHQYTIMERAST